MYTQEERQRALRHGLEAINRDLNKQARQNVAVWFPLGSCNERVLRIVSKEAVLLNSREKVGGRRRPCFCSSILLSMLASNTGVLQGGTFSCP